MNKACESLKFLNNRDKIISMAEEIEEKTIRPDEDIRAHLELIARVHACVFGYRVYHKSCYDGHLKPSAVCQK